MKIIIYSIENLLKHVNTKIYITHNELNVINCYHFLFYTNLIIKHYFENTAKMWVVICLQFIIHINGLEKTKIMVKHL